MRLIEQKKTLDSLLSCPRLHIDNSVLYSRITSLPQTYPTLIISVLHSYGTKMFPQFE